MDYYYSDSSMWATIISAYAIAFFIGVIFYILTAIGLMRIFQKVEENPIAAWIPIWNTWIMFKIAGMKPWFALIPLAGIIPFLGSIASLVGVVFLCIAVYNISLAFRKNGAWVVMYIFLPFVWSLYLGSRDQIWQGVPIPGGVMVSDMAYTTGYNANGSYNAQYGNPYSTPQYGNQPYQYGSNLPPVGEPSLPFSSPEKPQTDNPYLDNNDSPSKD